MQSIWKIKENKPYKSFQGVSPFVSQILINRGFDTPQKANLYLRGGQFDLYDPFLLKGMNQAVDRILKAKENNESVLIYGDYDVDGVTSTVIISKLLTLLKIRHYFFHPNRLLDGYGFHQVGIRIAQKRGCSLIITVDVGVGAVETVKKAKEVGIDVIITDHHKVTGEVPDAVAVIDHQQEDCFYPDKNLAGAGVAFKLTEAVFMAKDFKLGRDEFDNLISIAALGTVVDVAPLIGENRIITRLGLKAMNQRVNIGINGLCWAANIKKSINAGTLGFQLGPRLNAAGRLGDASLSTKLLLGSSEIDCLQIAEQLNKENVKRKDAQKRMSESAMEEIEKNPDIHGGPFLVVSAEGWHRGIVGLIASDLQEKYYKPTIVITTKNGMGHGSARSIPEFHMFNALQEHAHFFLGYGGHKQAAGLSMKSEDISLFREKINEYTSEKLSAEDLRPKLNIDLWLNDLSQLNLQTVEGLSMMEPFGYGNPAPVFMAGYCKTKFAPHVVNGGHLKFRIIDKRGYIVSCIGWGMADRVNEIDGRDIDIVFHAKINEFNQNKMVELEVLDLRESIF